MYEVFGISKEVEQIAEEAENSLKNVFAKIDEQCMKSSIKVLKAFQDNGVSTTDFNEVTGYGYYDGGREKLEKVYAEVFGTEDALVRPQIMSGTHALYLVLSGILRHGDTLLSISGEPYDTIMSVIDGESGNSLKNNGIKFEVIDLVDNDFDDEKIANRIRLGNIKMVEIQRSRGYANRKSLTIEKIERIIKLIKEIDNNIIVLVDNCYGEFVEDREPTEVGADLCASSLMKNLGAGIATSGGYVVGRKDLIELVADRLAFPTAGKNLGANFNVLLTYYKGIFMAPKVVASAIKSMCFASLVLEKLGYKVSPTFDEKRTDIIQTIELGDEQKLIDFCQSVQKGAPIESYVVPVPSEMPGYPHEEIMAGGTFTPGATIEFSCDGPLCEPFTAYMQGGLTYEYGKLEVLIAVQALQNNKKI